MTKVVYVCGPMTGYPDHNFPAFRHTTMHLRRWDYYEVVCPSEGPTPEDQATKGWAWCLAEDIKKLVDCDVICLLSGWQNSRGATLEMIIAWCLGKDFIEIGHIGVSITHIDRRYIAPKLVYHFLRNHIYESMTEDNPRIKLLPASKETVDERPETDARSD